MEPFYVYVIHLGVVNSLFKTMAALGTSFDCARLSEIETISLIFILFYLTEPLLTGHMIFKLIGLVTGLALAHFMAYLAQIQKFTYTITSG